MSKYKKLIVIPCVIIIVSLYLIGANLLNRMDRVDNIRDAVPVSADIESSETASENADENNSSAPAPKTEAEEDEQLKEITDKININTATKGELMHLDGIGTTLAGRIIEKREALGGFKSIEQLMNVKGIGTKTFNSIKDYVTIE